MVRWLPMMESEMNGCCEASMTRFYAVEEGTSHLVPLHGMLGVV